jgi:hypothetical protein
VACGIGIRSGFVWILRGVLWIALLWVTPLWITLWIVLWIILLRITRRRGIILNALGIFKRRTIRRSLRTSDSRDPEK